MSELVIKASISKTYQKNRKLNTLKICNKHKNVNIGTLYAVDSINNSVLSSVKSNKVYKSLVRLIKEKWEKSWFAKFRNKMQDVTIDFIDVKKLV